MKTAVSLPDRLFDQAEQLARRLHKSRSEVYREALELYLARHDRDEIRERLDLAIDALGQPSDDFVRTATRRSLEKSEW